MGEFPEREKFDGCVLIVDDDDAFRRLLVRRATRMGLNVADASNGSQAIALVHAAGFDVVVADLYMPEQDGLQVIKAAHEKDPDIQTIILTASATVETAVQALRNGAFDYLTKPLSSLADFELVLTRALELRRLRQENARLFQEVRRLAVTDTLTGLYNRRKLEQTLSIEMERAERYNRPLAMVMLDLDNMKAINDNHGHPAGDEVLLIVADAIRKHIRRVDVAARYGGDEFIVILPEAEWKEAEAVASRVVDQIHATKFRGSSLSVSAGVVPWQRGMSTEEAFIECVDRAMYKAKRAGGSQVAVLREGI